MQGYQNLKLLLIKFDVNVRILIGLLIFNSGKMYVASVTERINECNEVVIQKMEQTIQHKIVYLFLQERKIYNEVK